MINFLKKSFNKKSLKKKSLIKKSLIKKSLKKSKKNINLSLYADYHPKTSMKGLGYKNKKIAIKTLKLIKNKPLKYQKSLINTMIGRAEYHPHQTKDMKEAIKVFKNFKKSFNKNLK